MKSMKGLSMNRMFKRRPNGDEPQAIPANPGDETPEAAAARCVRAFCKSGGPQATGDEVTYLPVIVEAAESSPAAAAECARQIRKLLNRDLGASWQYNAIMLMRILADNPGQTFTRHLADKKFVDVAKELLRTGRDGSVHHMLMETLGTFEATREYDEGLTPLMDMWRKEKGKAARAYGGQLPPPVPRTLIAPAYDPHSQNYFARPQPSTHLPDPIELASRLEEARTSAKLLSQVVACTPPAEVLSNDLIREFADRCQSATASIQRFMTAENPGPDNDTMESLIDANEQVQTALSQRQRAVLSARKHLGLDHLGLNERSDNPSPAPSANGQRRRQQQQQPQQQGGTGRAAASPQPSGSYTPPPPAPGRRPLLQSNGKGKERGVSPVGVSPVGGPSRSANSTPSVDDAASDNQDPFRDPQPEWSAATDQPSGEQRLAFEPFHPGFGTTSSYLGRQDSSATSKVAVHGADAPGVSTGGSSRPQQENIYDDDDDRYDVTPNKSNREAM